MGSTMSNLGNLLKMPKGCGEQNMLNFAPNVFVALYLQRIGRLDEETRKTALNHIIDGYMNQLRYHTLSELVVTYLVIANLLKMLQRKAI